jgi:hypothetical protein
MSMARSFSLCISVSCGRQSARKMLPYANVPSDGTDLFFAIAADRSRVRQAELYVGIDLR